MKITFYKMMSVQRNVKRKACHPDTCNHAFVCLKISTANQPPVCAHTRVYMHTNIQVCTQMDILAHLMCVCVCVPQSTMASLREGTPFLQMENFLLISSPGHRWPSAHPVLKAKSTL